MLRHLPACRIECDGCGRAGAVVVGYGVYDNARRAIGQVKQLGWLPEQGSYPAEETRWRCPRCQVEYLLASQGVVGVRITEEDDPFVIR